MKISFLGDAQSIHIKRWLEYFRDGGHEVSIITFRPAKIDGVQVIDIGENIDINSFKGKLNYIWRINKIKKVIREINPDIINAHYLTSYGLIGAIIKDRPLVVSTWGSDILVTPYRNIIMRKLTEYVIKKSDLITSDSKFMSDKILELKAKKNKVLTVPMGIEREDFNLNERKDKQNQIRFLSMRTLCDNSNIDIILKAFKNIQNNYQMATLTITNIGDMEEKIKEEIKKLGLEENIEFMGLVSRETVVRQLKECNYYISIPTSDSTSVTLLEAMACGIFPIVSDIPANREWIEDRKNGLIIDKITVGDLTKCMEEAIINKDLVNKSRYINDDIINKRALWKENMEIVLEKYKQMI